MGRGQWRWGLHGPPGLGLEKRWAEWVYHAVLRQSRLRVRLQTFILVDAWLCYFAGVSEELCEKLLVSGVYHPLRVITGLLRVCVCGGGAAFDLGKSPVACSRFFAHQTAFFRQHGCTANDANTKYNSRAAQMYREKIRQLGSAALARHGTDVSACSLGLASWGEWACSESCVSVVPSPF